MGEYADMMIDGTCCQECGQFIDDGYGFPRFCDDCGGDPETCGATKKNLTTPKSKPFPCGHCQKRFTTLQGVKDHERSVHGE